MEKGKTVLAAGILTAVLMAAVLITAAWREDRFGQKETGPEKTGMLVELFVLNPCESCREEEKFAEAVWAELETEPAGAQIVCRSYNVFRSEDREYMEERLSELGLSAELSQLPFALAGDRLYQGSYEEIAGSLQETVSGRDRNTIPDREQITKTDIGLLLFTTAACESCESVKSWLEKELPQKTVRDAGQVSTIKLLEENITEDGKLEFLNRLFEQYQVPSTDQQVPILFYSDGYLSGEAQIRQRLLEILESGQAAAGYPQQWTAEEDAEKNEETAAGTFSWWQAVLTGLINGLNPCAASMLLMVLSLLLASGTAFTGGSLCYLAGKLAAYMGMGMGLLWLFRLADSSGYRTLERGITVLFAFLALLLSMLNLADYRNVRRREYGKVIVQLPEKLRGFNHRLIEKSRRIPKGFLFPALFLLGLVISAGEFFCTGQLYAASVFSLAGRQEKPQEESFFLLAAYVLAMCVPQLLLVLVIRKSRNLLAASRLMLSGMPAVKLIYGIVFFLLFVFLLFF